MSLISNLPKTKYYLSNKRINTSQPQPQILSLVVSLQYTYRCVSRCWYDDPNVQEPLASEVTHSPQTCSEWGCPHQQCSWHRDWENSHNNTLTSNLYSYVGMRTSAMSTMWTPLTNWQRTRLKVVLSGDVHTSNVCDTEIDRTSTTIHSLQTCTRTWGCGYQLCLRCEHHWPNDNARASKLFRWLGMSTPPTFADLPHFENMK